MTEEWHPKPEVNWSLEERCTSCRMPEAKLISKEQLRYTPVSCRGCAFVEIFSCSECKEELAFCHHTNNPPFKDIDKKRKCIWYDEYGKV